MVLTSLMELTPAISMEVAEEYMTFGIQDYLTIQSEYAAFIKPL